MQNHTNAVLSTRWTHSCFIFKKACNAWKVLLTVPCAQSANSLLFRHVCIVRPPCKKATWSFHPICIFYIDTCSGDASPATSCRSSDLSNVNNHSTCFLRHTEDAFFLWYFFPSSPIVAEKATPTSFMQLQSQQEWQVTDPWVAKKRDFINTTSLKWPSARACGLVMGGTKTYTPNTHT